MRGYKRDGTRLGFKKGYNQSEEHRKNISEALKGRPSNNPFTSDKNPMKNPIIKERARKSILKGYKNGRKPWNTDKNHPSYEKHINMISKLGSSSKGRVPWNKGLTKSDPSVTYGCPGESNPMWRGGKSIGTTYGYYDPGWKKQRIKVLKRDGYKCVRCGATSDLIVDHKIPWRISKDNSLMNLQTLCRHHHGIKTTKEERMFDYYLGVDVAKKEYPSPKIRHR